MLSLLLIASLLSIALAQVISLHGTPDLPSNALVEPARTQPDFRRTPPQPTGPDLTNDLELLDIVLLASIDGKFHALNRTSGDRLWSMAPDSSSSTPGPTALSPLVGTHHIDHDPETTDESTQQEAYIIEPQSGDIYVMTNPSSPLQRFPFTMQELVDLAPVSFKGESSQKSFVGKKESSLLVIELETGKIKATLNSECPWDQFEDFRDDGGELDLDELEGSKPPKPPVTEVYIGRTDYHVSIITRPLNRDTPYTNRPQIQNLSFSIYGPNKQDNHLQNLYRHTKDNTYIQSLPNGEIISFKARSAVDSVIQAPNSHLMWAQPFNQPIVAVFDVLRRTPDHHMGPHPIVLLQPRPNIQDLLPGLSPSTKENLSSAYVGLVEETGSLYAMSSQRYPLVAFSQTKYYHQGRLIDSSNPSIFVGRPGDKAAAAAAAAGAEDKEGEEPTSVDEITRLRKERDAAARAQEQELQCHDRIINDRRCLVGVRKLELDVGDGAETRMKRLIDPPPEPSLEDIFDQQQQRQHNTGYENHQPGTVGGSQDVPPRTIDPPKPSDVVVPVAASGWGFWEMLGGTVVLGILSFLFLKNPGLWRQLAAKVNNRPGVVAEPELPPPPLQELTLEPRKVETQKETEEEDIPNGATPEPSIIQTRIPQVEDKSDWQMVDPPTPPPLGGGGAFQSTPPTPVPATPTPGAMPTLGDETDREDLDGAATEVEEETPAKNTEATPKKRTRRGKRGAKKPKNAANGDATPNGNASGGSGGGKMVHGKVKEKEKDNEEVEETKTPQSSLILTTSAKSNVVAIPSLIVSETVLGYGSHGTVVYQGSLQGRAVAVKRLLADFVTLASREVSILQESDDHPNVIRYYYQEAQAGFLYIALELCPASLADLIETPDRDAWRDIAVSFDPKRALRQVTNGLRHLHGLKLVHRDIKPQNILVSTKGVGTVSGKSSGGGGSGGGAGARGAQYRMLISDFGLCKKLDVDQTSFLPTAHGAMAAGTVGWRAPEILSGEVKLNELSDDQSTSSRGSTATINGNSSISSTSSNNSANGGKGRTRLTKSVDIFALGCLYYYTLTGGGHPFGDRYEREVNIMKNAKNLELLERFGEEGTEAADLIEKMLDPTPSERPDTASCLLHPFFWDSSRRLNFLQDASDRFEIMCRDPRDPRLVALEKDAQNVVGNDWHSRLDRVFIDNLGKFRKYDGKSIQDLLRALRNKKHHYQDLPDNVKRHLGPMPDGYLAYFTRRYPNLFLHVHRVVKETGLVEESMFRSYFELPES